MTQRPSHENWGGNQFQTKMDTILSNKPASPQEVVNAFDDIISTPRNLVITAAVFFLGLFLFILSIMQIGLGFIFPFAFVMMAVGAAIFLIYFKTANRRQNRNDRIFDNSLARGDALLTAQLRIFEQMPQAEIIRLGHAAGLEQTEMQMVLTGAVIENASRDAYLENRLAASEAARVHARSEQEAAWARQFLAAEAQAKVTVSGAEAEANRSMASLLAQIEHDKAVGRIQTDKDDFDRKMTELSKTHTHSAQMEKLQLVSRLQGSIVGSQAALINNPGIETQMGTVSSAFQAMLTKLASPHLVSEDDLQPDQEMLDEVLTALVRQNVGLKVVGGNGRPA